MSSRIKAAENRHLSPIVASIWAEVMDSACQHDRDVHRVLQNLAEFYDVMSSPDYCLSAADRRKLEICINGISRSYRFLQNEAIAADRNRWHEVNKHHTMQHILQHAQFSNPRFSWCYPDEDFMRIVKKIAERCMSATPAFQIVPKLVQKWLFGFVWRLECGARP